MDNNIYKELVLFHNMFIFDKKNKFILLVEIDITSFYNLRTFKTEKKHKYDILSNHGGSMHEYKTKRIPYVIAWYVITNKLYKHSRKELNIDNSTQGYIRFEGLKMIFESLSMDARRGAVLTRNLMKKKRR